MDRFSVHRFHPPENPKQQIVYAKSERPGRPLMVLHGLGGSHRHFRHLLEHPPEGFQVFAPDLPGFGRSFRTRTFPSPELIGSHLSALIEDEGLHNTVLVGHSYGGQAALALAQRVPGISALILVSSSGLMMPSNPMAPPRFSLISHFLIWLISTDRVGEQVVRNLGSRPERISPQVRLDMKISFRQAHALSRIRKIPYDPQFLACLSALTVPAGTIWAERDTLFPHQEATRLAGHLPLKVVQGVGHAWPMEDPELFAEEVLAMLSRLEHGGAEAGGTAKGPGGG